MVKSLALTFCCADCAHSEVCMFKKEASKFYNEEVITLDIPNIWIPKVECEEYQESSNTFIK